ncbi:MAG: M42 family peptidase, partial [Anaerolineales bacterium]|nr:M42 family peptidase [Anaerolineales bacterium]
MKQLLQRLTETFSPSGYEDSIRELIRKEIKPYADNIRVDALGNLIARKGRAAARGKRIMIAAHMDEIGLIASHIDARGFVRFSTVGGVHARNLAGGRVRFVNGATGVIGVHDGVDHPSVNELFIDVGASSKKDCPVKVGDIAAFERPFMEMGSRWVAKSLDDRVGVLVVIETMRALKSTPHEIHFVFTTQEEIGVRGATTASYGVDPELGLAVDVTLAADTPHAAKMEVQL